MNTTLISRRSMLKTVAAASICSALPTPSFSQNKSLPEWQSKVLAYLETLRRPDGGYAWDELAISHLTPSFAAIGCYHTLGMEPPRKKELAEFVRTHHPRELKKLEQEHRDFEYQQIQSLIWLGEDASSFKEQIRALNKPYTYLKQYEQHGWPVFRSEMASFTCRKLLGMPLDDLSPEYIKYLESRRRANGSFNMSPADDGSDGNILNTIWGLQALASLGRLEEKKSETIKWLQACQIMTVPPPVVVPSSNPSLPAPPPAPRPDQMYKGGFTHQPQPIFAGWDDIAYTWAAVHALAMLGTTPTDRADCVNYIESLRSDGGFGDRPGWAPNPMATFYAVSTLKQLRPSEEFAGLRQQPLRQLRSRPIPNLNAYTIQIEAHGNGSPSDAVEMARSLRVHLWGAKNAKPGWLAKAQSIADQQNVPVTFFTADEEYGTWVTVPGMGTYSHTSDIFAPPGVDFGPSMAGKGVSTWPQYREQRLAPLQKAGGHVIWQFGENEELVRLYLDDSIQRGGYAAISTFHFGNPDFTNSEPFLRRYRGQIPYIGLQDAHGPEPWWFGDMTTGFRTVFLASSPTWANWLTALKNNWLVAVRRDTASGGKLWIHGGAKEVIDTVRKQEDSWRWWDNPNIQRPMVSLVAVKPEDEFEGTRPEKGLMLRVRCARENTTQGVPKRALAEFVKLTVDGNEVTATPFEKKGGGGKQAGAITDYQHQYHLPNPTTGKHTATAVVRLVDTKKEVTRTIEFMA
jgi:hypothetical protein